jgi:predicted nucleotidyltransferase
MEKLTIQDLRDRGWIAFEYVRGSHAYGLNTETSDKDIGGVFIIPQDYLMGLRSNYIEQVADETNDTVFYEFGRWIELLMKANPTALESLFIPEHCIIGPIHPAIKYIMDNRDSF